jgi:hypothetical protein
VMTSVLTVSDRRVPTEARVPGGTGHLLPIPVDHQAAEGKSALCPGLPVHAASHGPTALEGLVALADREPFGIDRACIDEMTPGQEARYLLGRMQGRVRLTVINWPRGGQYVGDQRRHHVLTGFSQVPCVPDLLDAVLASIVGIEVVGRADEPRRGGDVVVIAPGHPAVLVREIVLHPDLAQRIPSGQGVEVRRRLSTIHRVQHAAGGPSDALGSVGAPHDGPVYLFFSGISQTGPSTPFGACLGVRHCSLPLQQEVAIPVDHCQVIGMDHGG